jgi:hypothetical protein
MRRIFRSTFVFYNNEKPVKNHGHWFANCKLPPGKTEVTLTITGIVTVITSYGYWLLAVNNQNCGNTR